MMSNERNSGVQAVRLIPAKTVARILKINVRTVWKFMQNKPNFPQPLKRFPRYTRWNEADILNWRDTPQI